MNNKYVRLKLPATFILLSFSIFSSAQVGRNDSTFNIQDNAPDDIVKKIGDYPSLAAAQANGDKIVITGNFLSYKDQTHNRIVRILANGDVDATFNTGTGFNSEPSSLLIQPDNSIIVGGSFTEYNGTSVRPFVRLLENGNIDNTFLTNTAGYNINQMVLQNDGKVLALVNYYDSNMNIVRAFKRLNMDGTTDTTLVIDSIANKIGGKFAVQADGKIIVAVNESGSIVNLIRLNTNGSVDSSFNAKVPINATWHHITMAIGIQTDGKIIIGGLTAVGTTYYYFLNRINENGSVDSTFKQFDTSSYLGAINSIQIQSDGKIVVAGHKDKYTSGFETNYNAFLARLNPDGSLDRTFIQNQPIDNIYGNVSTMILLPGNKIFGVGIFYELNAFTAKYIVLLNADGSIDLNFNKSTGVNGMIAVSRIQADQKILIGGRFSGVQSNKRNYFARLLADGSLDSTLNPEDGPNGPVFAIVQQLDGKIIIGGKFSSYNGHTANNIVRINDNGSIDTTYHTAIDGIVYSLELQHDKLIVGGDFMYTLNNIDRFDIARLNSNGSFDAGFTGELSGLPYEVVKTMLVLPDEKIMVGGSLSAKQNNALRTNLVRLDKDGLLDTTFFRKNGPYAPFYDLLLQPDKKIIACGGTYGARFTSPVGFIVRYTSDGTVDPTWINPYPNSSNPVLSATLLSTGKIIVGGSPQSNIGLKTTMLLDSTGKIDSTFIGTIDGPVYTTQSAANGKAIIGGHFNRYTIATRNNIARIIISDSTTSIQKYPKGEDFVIYPNPASNYINAENLKPGSTVTIRNILGAIIYREQINAGRAVIPINTYSNGVYFISQENKGEISTQRFVVNK